MKKQFVLPAALLLALGATTALGGSAAFAQASTASASSAPAPALGPAPWDQRHGDAHQPGPHHGMMQGHGDPHHRFDFTARAEARIAYVKAELKITPAQETAFDKYAQIIRDNAATTQKTFEDMRGGHGQNETAIDRVEQRAKMAQMRDQEQQQYLAAFRPLYASLSPDQKKVADDLATPHRHFGYFGHSGEHRG
ncbi:MAG TPA: Spy/CpxP family protein refolding chaperone [Stellaceae bacterium]|nr:Spy/CpxP family protein refolding chaperone [Stellaceae bacterium]